MLDADARADGGADSGGATAAPGDDDFASLFAFLPIGAYRTRPDGTPVRANPALVRLHGYASEAELIAAARDVDGERYVDPSRRAEFQRRLERDGQVLGLESEIRRHRTRERIWISENAHVVRDADGRVLYHEGTVEEITERVRAREALDRSRQQLHQIVELVPGVVYRLVTAADGSTHFAYLGRQIGTLLGADPATDIDPGWLCGMRHPDDRPWVEAAIADAARTGRPLSIEFRLVLGDGSEKWVQQISNAAPPEDGRPVRVGLLLDVTARKRAEEALRDNGEVWRRALESTGDGAWDLDLRTGIERLSRQCKALYGYGDDELDEIDALDRLTHPDDVEAMLRARADHSEGRSPAYVNEHRVRCKDGRWKWILSRGYAIQRDRDGRAERMIGTHTDLTAVKQAEALRHERDRAEAADQAKSQFLSRVSHELRTPLNAILGFAQLLEIDPAATERQRTWIGHVLTSGRHLLALMDDILDISSVQSGQLPTTAVSVPLRPLLDEVGAMLAAFAASHAVTIVDDVDAASALSVRADARRLKQIVSNLLSNAIKYNHAGGTVRIVARRDGASVVLAVADTGPGIAAADLARLFTPFERLGVSAGTAAGTGLGLALSRQLAEAMGGTIDVDSVPGHGSTFSVRLPAG